MFHANISVGRTLITLVVMAPVAWPAAAVDSVTSSGAYSLAAPRKKPGRTGGRQPALRAAAQAAAVGVRPCRTRLL
jgi:hypothetical protein